jgi:hypothetical protein
MPADVKVYQISAGGVRELMDEWSVGAKRNTSLAVMSELTGKTGLSFKEFSPGNNPLLDEEYQDVKPLFEAVARSILSHTYQPETQFSEKREKFDYTLGPVQMLAQAAEADALLFVYGVDNVSTAGRVALQTIGMILAAAAGVVIVPQGGQTVLIAALVDPGSGDVLWFDVRSSGGVHDLRKPESAGSLVSQLFSNFIGAKK